MLTRSMRACAGDAPFEAKNDRGRGTCRLRGRPVSTQAETRVHFADEDEKYTDTGFDTLDWPCATVIGEGTYGVVYKVPWPSKQYPRRVVAVKYPDRLAAQFAFNLQGRVKGARGEVVVPTAGEQKATEKPRRQPCVAVMDDNSDSDGETSGDTRPTKGMPRVLILHAENIEDEHNILLALRHLHILPVYPLLAPPLWMVGKTAKNMAIVTKYCNLGTLANVSDCGGEYGLGPTAWVGHVALCCARALLYSHCVGFAHGDLTEYNVLFHSPYWLPGHPEDASPIDIPERVAFSMPYLGDFSCAVNLREPLENLRVLYQGGSVMAMPPELQQVHGTVQVADTQTGAWNKLDVWSLGMLLLELAYGSVSTVRVHMENNNINFSAANWIGAFRNFQYGMDDNGRHHDKPQFDSFSSYTAWSKTLDQICQKYPQCRGYTKYCQVMTDNFDHSDEVVTALNEMLAGMLDVDPTRRWNLEQVLTCSFVSIHGQRAHALVKQKIEEYKAAAYTSE